jgi:TetR/AcrR family transcriptional repressor of nem operon
VNTATELGLQDAAAAERVDRGLGALHDAFAAAVRRGQAAGELAGGLDPDAAAAFLVTTVVGLRARARTSVAEDDLHSSVEMALRALD